MFAVVSHEMTERQAEADAAAYRFNPLLFVPGLALAIVVHAAFNHFPDRPGEIMLATLMLTPIVLYVVFARNERAVKAWLASDQDAHRRLLDEIRSGQFAESEHGRALVRLADRFQNVDASDVFHYFELKTELVLRAEELIHATLADASPAAAAPDDREKIAELDALEARLGRSVLAAVAPRLGFSRNDLWELERFRQRVKNSSD